MVHGTNHFFFSPRQPLHSIICSILFRDKEIQNLILSSSIGDFLTFFLKRPAYYAFAIAPNVYASLRLLTFFQDKEDSALLTLPLLRDHSSTLKAQQLTGCLVPSGWLAKNKKQKATKL
ncbi:hypothetical protein NE237_000104 [Protea cynaroides]|uniref:Uncharacterized protein n=1 Tax=Protea cynaroides TaxID=273540 RepID=A0A9Q0GPL4_9MAGN|nr:hypothetical protein NE237_000104 [Protea cynaroides]